MGAGQDRQYFNEVYLNSQLFAGPLLNDVDVTAGGVLQFILELPDGKGDVKVLNFKSLMLKGVGSSTSSAHVLDKQGDENLHLRQNDNVTLKPCVNNHAPSTVATKRNSEKCNCWYNNSNLYVGLGVLSVNAVILCCMFVLQSKKGATDLKSQHTGEVPAKNIPFVFHMYCVCMQVQIATPFMIGFVVAFLCCQL